MLLYVTLHHSPALKPSVISYCTQGQVFMYLPTRPPIHSFMCPPIIHPPIHPCIPHSSIHLSTHPSICPHNCPSTHPSVCPLIHPSFHQFIQPATQHSLNAYHAPSITFSSGNTRMSQVQSLSSESAPCGMRSRLQTRRKSRWSHHFL